MVPRGRMDLHLSVILLNSSQQQSSNRREKETNFVLAFSRDCLREFGDSTKIEHFYFDNVDLVDENVHIIEIWHVLASNTECIIQTHCADAAVICHSTFNVGDWRSKYGESDSSRKVLHARVAAVELTATIIKSTKPNQWRITLLAFQCSC